MGASSMRRSVFGLVCIAGLAAGCSARDTNGTIVASGYVEATEVRLATKIGGTLITLGVKEGDHVTRGQKLAQIDPTDLQLALNTARAERGQAAADLALRQAGFRREEIAEAKNSLAQLQTELEGAERELARFQGLLDSGAGVAKTRDDARTRRDALAAGVRAATDRLRKLESGFRGEEIAAAQARLAAADARIAQLEQQIKDTTLVSPAAGVITEKLVEQGELLPAGTPVLVITDLQDCWLTVYVSEPDLGVIRLGQEIQVVTDDGQSRTGRVTFIASQAEFTPKNVQTRDERAKLVYKLKIGLPNQDGLFKTGMPAEARIGGRTRG